jgi:hypothetical protein
VDTTTAYAEIVKHERDPATGDLLVYGRATSPDLDLDQQVCDPGWLAKAMPEWFASGANVREQHSSIAAGVGTELAQNGQAWDLRARVVDPVSARKVEAGVLKGYSIGIRGPQIIKDAAAPNGRITGGQIVEVSLVDRPANPTCTLTLAKALKPGPNTAVAVDSARSLMRVEELHDRTGEPLAAYKQLVVDLAQADDETADIASAQQAIAIIARLIQSEADGLAAGDPGEAADIDLLLAAVRALEWFQSNENTEEAPMATTVVDLAAQAATTPAAPDAAKGTTPTPAPAATPPQTPAPDAPPAVEGGEDLTELVKALATKVDSLSAEWAKVAAQPAPGGPVLTRTTEDTAKAAGREHTLAKAAEYERLAYELNDPQARSGYLQMAAEARAAATS